MGSFRAVVGQIDVWWEQFFRPRLHGLTDDEYLWEPAPGSWTIRPSGDGLVEVDFDWPPPQPAPVTTLAWRMSHIALRNLAQRTTSYFTREAAGSPQSWDAVVAWRSGELGVFNFTACPHPIDTAGALDFLDEWFAAWRRGLDAAGEERLWQPMGPAEFDAPTMQLGVADPFAHKVLHVHRELMHHGGEIGLLRDLYRTWQPSGRRA